MTAYIKTNMTVDAYDMQNMQVLKETSPLMNNLTSVIVNAVGIVDQVLSRQSPREFTMEVHDADKDFRGQVIPQMVRSDILSRDPRNAKQAYSLNLPLSTIDSLNRIKSRINGLATDEDAIRFSLQAIRRVHEFQQEAGLGSKVVYANNVNDRRELIHPMFDNSLSTNLAKAAASTINKVATVFKPANKKFPQPKA